MMTQDSPSDLELVRGLHARDRQAFAYVYVEYSAALYNLCARILDDREEAKDVTQDVFLKAFDRPPAETEDVRLRPWLYRVATNVCLNRIRGRRPRGPFEIESLAAAPDPYEQARSAELIERSLAGLNERYRAALVLTELHGVRGSELADVLSISRPAADVLVHRARASFRRAFAALAGDGAPAPANLALALPALTVPAALHAIPIPPGGLAPTGPLLPDPGATAAASAGPVAGAMAKITAALGAKAIVAAASAVVVAGGGLAAVELAGDGTPVAPSSSSEAPAAHPPKGSARDGHGVHHSPLEGWTDHRHAVQHHLDDRRRPGDAHPGDGGHTGARDDGASRAAASEHGDATATSADLMTSTSDGHEGMETTHGAGEE